jgi:hypothetical protein
MLQTHKNLKNMANLFLFGIGGTGARVVKSLTMLLAAGMELKDSAGNPTTLIPILIDSDAKNGDVAITIDMINKYNAIYKAVNESRDAKAENFFKTPIKMLGELQSDKSSDGQIANTYHFDLNNKGQAFKEFIGYGDLINQVSNSKHLIDLLFQKSSLDDSLDVGFKGNPNVGSVVLNKLSEFEVNQAHVLEYFANQFKAGDRIFIVSSIFGGTGASGFPILLKTLRNPDFVRKIGNTNYEFPNKVALKQAIVGCMTVMPYFKVQVSDTSMINSNTFITKTRVALDYYNRHLTNDKVNAFYYLGDNKAKQYDNKDGGKEQTNDAHYIEMLAASSVFHFMQQPDGNLQDQTKHHRFAVNDMPDVLKLDNFRGSNDQFGEYDLAKKLIMFKIFARWHKDYILTQKEKDELYVKGLKAIENRDKAFYKAVGEFVAAFQTWLSQLANNDRMFAPFNENAKDDKDFISGRELPKTFSGYENDFRSNVNANFKKLPQQNDEGYLRVMYQTAEQTFKERVAKSKKV